MYKRMIDGTRWVAKKGNTWIFEITKVEIMIAETMIVETMIVDLTIMNTIMVFEIVKTLWALKSSEIFVS